MIKTAAFSFLKHPHGSKKIILRELWAQIEKVVLKYYSELFHSSNPTDFTKILFAIQPIVSTTMNQMLTGDFQESEVCKALKQMFPLKAPSPDGMLPLFFLAFLAYCWVGGY